MEYLLYLKISSISISHTKYTKVFVTSDVIDLEDYINEQLKTYRGEIYDLYIIKKGMLFWVTANNFPLRNHIIGKYNDTKFHYYPTDITNKYSELISKTKEGQVEYKLDDLLNFFDLDYDFCHKYQNKKIEILHPKVNNEYSYYVIVGQEKIFY